MISVPSFLRFLAKTKRSEAYINLRSLYMAEKNYWIEHGSYTTQLTGENGLGWKPEGKLQYTYGFPGSEGKNYVMGSLKTPAAHLQNTHASTTSFTIAAAGYINGENNPDVLTIDQDGNIKQLKDALA